MNSEKRIKGGRVMTQTHKKDELYSNLFKSIKAGLGIDLKEIEPQTLEEMKQALFDRKYGFGIQDIMIAHVHRGKSEGYLKNLPPELAQYLRELLKDLTRKAKDRKEYQAKQKLLEAEDQAKLETEKAMPTVH